MLYADALRLTTEPAWGPLLLTEKKAALQAIEHHIALFEGRDERFVMVENMDDGYCGYYDHDDRNHLHLSPLAMRDPDEAIMTVLHEGRHAFQHDCIDKNAGFPQPIIDQLRDGFENYVKPEKDFAAYANNFTETDAESFAEQQIRLLDMERNALLSREAAESEVPATVHARDAEAEAETPDAPSRTETEPEEMPGESEPMRAGEAVTEAREPSYAAEAETRDAPSRTETELDKMLRESEPMHAGESEAEAREPSYAAETETRDVRSRRDEELEEMLREDERAPQRYDWKNQTTSPVMERVKVLSLFRSESETNVNNLRDVDMSREDLEQYQDHFSRDQLPGIPDGTRGFMDRCLQEMQDSLDNDDSKGYSNARNRLLDWDELFRDDVGREASGKAESASAGETLAERDFPGAEASGPDLSAGTAEARDGLEAADRELDLAPDAAETRGAEEAAEHELDLAPDAAETRGAEEAAEHELDLAPGAAETRGAEEEAEHELDLAPGAAESRGAVEAYGAERWAGRASDLSPEAEASHDAEEAQGGEDEDNAVSQDQGITW